MGSDVHLRDALSDKYDSFYHTPVKVAYDRCELGYILDAEGPQVPLAYRHGISWHRWI